MKSIGKKALFILAALGLVMAFLSGCAGMGKPATVDSGYANGTWKGTGLDDRGVSWIFTFVLRQDGGSLSGTGQWLGSDGAVGTTTMTGTIDVGGRGFALDEKIAVASGAVAAASYKGSFSPDFQKMSGAWTIPGGGSARTFEAAKAR
jgi:hypothetical protein